MGARGIVSSIAIAAAPLCASIAAAETTHTYPVTLTIKVDRSAGKLSGQVLSDAPAQFCQMSTVRIRRVARGKDPIVGRVRPDELSEWHMRSTRAMHGARVYAEVLPYHLPSRPVVCLGARSRAVRAP
jgi:hypothetical protein